MSIVRENLLTRKGYTPYCGNDDCTWNMPRTRFSGLTHTTQVSLKVLVKSSDFLNGG